MFLWPRLEWAQTCRKSLRATSVEGATDLRGISTLKGGLISCAGVQRVSVPRQSSPYNGNPQTGANLSKCLVFYIQGEMIGGP